MRPFNTCVTQERGDERLTKKVTKSDVGGWVLNQKHVMALTKKNPEFCE